MAQALRIKMLDKDVELDLSGNTITKSSIKAVFLLPENWQTMQFFAESEVPSRPTTSMDQSMNARSINPYYFSLPPDSAPTAESFNNWMFYLHDQMGKAATICIHPRFFVTFRHGTHLQFEVGHALKMYSANKAVNEQVGYDVYVIKINEALDFILLKSYFDVVERGPSIAQANESEPFTLAGFGNEKQSLSYLSGTIHSVRDFYFSTFEGNIQQKGPFILGTSTSSGGVSGGGIWGSRGLVGMNVACTTMPKKLHNLAISEAAIFSPKNIITSSFRFKDAYMEEVRKEWKREKVASPPKKQPHYMVEFEGINFYGSSY